MDEVELTGVQAAPGGKRAEEPAVIVGLDGRDHDADALALGLTLVRALGGSLVLAHVIPPPPLGRGMTGYALEARRDGRALLERAVEEAGVPAHPELLETWPVPYALTELAQDQRAGMLVLASSHRGKLGRIVPGGVASHLLSRAPCPVAVAPVGYAGRGAAEVALVGAAYDGTSEADLALEAAAAAALRLGVPLRLYHAMHAVSEDPAWDEFRACMRRYAQGVVDAGLQRVPPQLSARGVVLEGDAAETIAAAAESERVDLLFVGSRGLGPLREALLGGFCGALLTVARCPLVIVPAGAAA